MNEPQDHRDFVETKGAPKEEPAGPRETDDTGKGLTSPSAGEPLEGLYEGGSGLEQRLLEQELPRAREGAPVFYPVMLNLQGQPCVIAGGGRVAERKAAGLLQAGARVTVVSPRLTPQLAAWAAAGRIRALEREYAPGLAALAEARLVFAATDDAAVNKAVLAEAAALGRWAASADAPEAGGFHVPAVVRRGRLTLAVSTAGASPAAAAKLKRQLEAQYGEGYAPYMDLLHALREAVQQCVPRSEERAQLLRAMLAWPLLELLESGRCPLAALRGELLGRFHAQPDRFGIQSIEDWLHAQLRKI